MFLFSIDFSHQYCSILFSFSGVNSKAYEANIGCSDSVNSLFSNIKQDFSAAPCIAVNAAGITRDTYMLKMSEQKFDEVITVNLKVGSWIIDNE